MKVLLLRKDQGNQERSLRKPVYTPPFSVITPPSGKVPVFALENRYLLVVSRAHDFDTRRLDLTLLEEGASFGDEKD